MKQLVRLLFILSVPALAACSADGDTPVPNYLGRLSRSLDVAPPGQVGEAPALPRSREMLITVEAGRIDLLDMLALGDCQLGVTIGKSNSSLGKLATASQRLLLELEFLSLAPACIETLTREGEPQLAEVLVRAMSEKRRQLPARIWNATLGGPEFRNFWQRPTSLANYPENTGGAVPDALHRLAQLVEAWLAGDYDSQPGSLEALLDILRRGDGGSLLLALAIQREGLGGATAQVHQRLDSPALCYGRQPSPEGRIFDNVVRKYFVGEVQPWAVDLARRHRELGDPVAVLENALADVQPGAYREWRHSRDQLLQQGLQAPRSHALALAELLDSCGLRPGSSPG